MGNAQAAQAAGVADSLNELYLFRPGGTPTIDGDVAEAYFSLESGRTAINSTTDPYPFLSMCEASDLNISNIGSAEGDSIQFTVTINATQTAFYPPQNLQASIEGKHSSAYMGASY